MIRTDSQFSLGVLLFATISSIVAPCLAAAEEAKGPSFPPAIERILGWFPEDTETLVAAQSFLVPPAEERNAFTLFSRQPATVFDRFIQLTSLEGLVEIDKGSGLEELTGKQIVAALRGSRNVDIVSSFGGLRSEGCGVVVFEDKLDDIAKTWIGKLREKSTEVRKLQGREVFVFPSTTPMEPWVKPKPWQGTFLVVLRPNTLLCATSDRYLEELLKRVDTKPAGRALANNVPEWSHLEPKQPAWLLRHIPGKSEQRIISGLTLVGKKSGFEVRYLPADKQEVSLEDHVRATWGHFVKLDELEIRLQANGAVTLTSATINPRYFFPLYHLAGEEGNVGTK